MRPGESSGDVKDREGRGKEGSEWGGDWDRGNKECCLINRRDGVEVGGGGET